MSIIHQNVRSIGNCLDQIQALLRLDGKCFCLCITEHWKSSAQLEHYQLAGYTLTASYCRGEGEHGGSAIYCRSDIKGTPRNDLIAASLCNVIECAAAEFYISGTKIIVLCIYRPEGNLSVFLTKLEQILTILSTEKCCVFIAGDFNIDIKKRDNCTSEFLMLLNSYNLYPSIHDYTRVTATTNSCIDNIYTDCDEYKSEVIQTHISDHTAQKLEFEIQIAQNDAFYYKRFFNEENKQAFVNKLSEETWCEVYSCDVMDVKRQWQLFLNSFIPIFNECFPKNLVKQNNSRKVNYYYSEKTTRLKDRLDVLLIISRNDHRYKAVYDTVRKQYNNALISDRKRYYSNKICYSDNKAKCVWQTVNQIKGNKNKIREVQVPGNPATVTEKFNEYLVEAASRLKIPSIQNAELDCILRANSKSFYLTPVLEEEVFEITNRLKNKMSSGIDEIPTSIIKFCIPQICPTLCHIINNSFQYGIFPDQLKVASVKLAYKKGDPAQMQNYRPLSLLPSFSKIFESAICGRLVNFFDSCGLFSSGQHGYRQGKSVETALYSFIQSVYDTLDSGELPLGVFLDLTKAFDCLDHSILLAKLEIYGIRGVTLHWFKSYLSERSQRVSLNKGRNCWHSRLLTINKGIPQGSILGPVLFIIYINDLTSIVTNASVNIVNYADDTNLLIKNKLFPELINSCREVVDMLQAWFARNKLLVNREKTDTVLFKVRNEENMPTKISVGDWEMPLSTCTKFLGLLIDDTLSWSEHIESLCGRLSAVCYSVLILSRYLDFDTLKVVYYANFQSILKYGIIFWGSSSHFNRVFVIQKRILRIMTRKKYRESCRDTFRQNNILTAYGVYIYEVLLFTYKNRENLVDLTYRHDYETRNINYMYPKHRLSNFEKSLLYTGIKMYNRLPNHVKGCGNLHTFKKSVFRFLILLEPYNMDEYLNNNGTR